MSRRLLIPSSVALIAVAACHQPRSTGFAESADLDASFEQLWQASLEQLEADLWPEIESGQIELSKEPRGLVMSLSESALFLPGEARLQARSIPIMDSKDKQNRPC